MTEERVVIKTLKMAKQLINLKNSTNGKNQNPKYPIFPNWFEYK
jgi:hypothetical protein